MMKGDGAAAASSDSIFSRSGQWEAGNLDNYVHFLRRRLKTVNSEVSLITVRGVGYVLE